MSIPHSQTSSETAPLGDAAPQTGHRVVLGAPTPMKLDSGLDLAGFTLAYQTYGTLNAARSNAILACHALTGDQFAAGLHPVTGKRGWWDNAIGPGKPLDTDKYFIICSNILGGCMGTIGPKELNPATGKPFSLAFPVITIGDMVKAQKLLIDHLGIDQFGNVFDERTVNAKLAQPVASAKQVFGGAAHLAARGGQPPHHHRLVQVAIAGSAGVDGESNAMADRRAIGC